MAKQLNSPNYISLDAFNGHVIDATIEKCASFTNNRILNAIKQRWTTVLRQRMDAINSGAHISHFDTPSVTVAHQPSGESSDDEFDDAEVECIRPSDMIDTESSVEATQYESVAVEAPYAESMPEPLQPSNDGEDVDDDISISDVSDLDDKIPETRDLVIGMLDKVTRPSSKKSSTPMWKVKLKYGVLQINGVEIPFENMEGDFEF
ncbi:DNA-directed RNA polymerase II large subunit [Babesia divergens]|uniref:DNA-directed RNA polymerase II large subunit n=1 Tax=Babesia divergens TaxID=32595 RepID=A0AAD9GCZ3_BABDI|nr:DNA-directed RNA polymerase II large subunit [Babesia divergens]